MPSSNPKDNSRKRGVAEERRRQRQQEATERQAAHDKLSPEDQLARLEARPGSSERERKRLLSAIDSRRKVAAKKTKKK